MTTTKQKKNSKLRYLEYYDLQDTLDMLYADSGRRKIFNNLMPLIESEENIRLAYRNIKRNSGSNTSGVDKLTIKDIEKIPETRFVEIVRKKLQWYKPKAVRRVEIPKPNGKLRPLGIPAIWDRIVNNVFSKFLNLSVKLNLVTEVTDFDLTGRQNTLSHKPMRLCKNHTCTMLWTLILKASLIMSVTAS